MFQNLKPKCFKTSILVSILKDDSGALSASNSTIVTLFFKDSDFSGNSKVPPIHKNHKTYSCYNCRNVLTLSQLLYLELDFLSIAYLTVSNVVRLRICNHGHNILELYNILEKFEFTTSKVVVSLEYITLYTSCLRKFSKLGGDRAQCPAFLPEIKL